MEDIQIARSIKLHPISEIAQELMIQEDELELYGKFKAKINPTILKRLREKKEGKLILVTSINPTPLGEGKTTMAIGLADGMRKIGKKSILALREPSMGPVFGIKGGATGGGFSQIAPMDEINLHFTGDLHAITSANNLLSSMIDNHIYFGNELKLKTVLWKRCMDVNDRSLREIEINLSPEKNNIPRRDSFDITAASEMMAIFCLATDIDDLKKRIGNILIGYNEEDEPVYAKDLKAEGALTALLKDAFMPNLVQTLEHTPAIVHGGPFANIAHGCNSIIATKMALKLGDYTITEAGFGADLGAEKFLNITERILQKVPDVVVCVATIKALKYHGGMPKEELDKENLDFLNKGMKNLMKHVHNLKEEFGLNIIVAINQYTQDTEQEIRFLSDNLIKDGISLCLVESWSKGGNGAKSLANEVVQLCEKPNNFHYTYDLSDSILNKMRSVAQKLYGAQDVELSEEAIKSIDMIEKFNKSNLPVCIAKTQYSLSDDPKNLECKDPFNIYIRDVALKNGAEFLVAYAGKIYTMPGLPKVPAAENIDIDENGNIVGIF